MDATLNKLSLYNDWANQLLFESFAQQAEKIPAISMRLLSHLVNTQVVWLSRIKGEAYNLTAWDEHSLDVCKEMHQRSFAVLQTLVTADDNGEAIITYANFQGIKFENSVNDILLQVLNHGTYHRAQIAQDMRKNGLEPVNTDYITFVREKALVR